MASSALLEARTARRGGVDSGGREFEREAVGKAPPGDVARLEAQRIGRANGADHRLLLRRTGAPRPAAARNQQERLAADGGDDACPGARSAAEAGMELPPAPAVGGEGEARNPPNLPCGGWSEREAFGVALAIAQDRSPMTASGDDRPAAGERRSWQQQGKEGECGAHRAMASAPLLRAPPGPAMTPPKWLISCPNLLLSRTYAILCGARKM